LASNTVSLKKTTRDGGHRSAIYPAIEIPVAAGQPVLQPERGYFLAGLDARRISFANWTINAGGGYWITPGDKNYWFTGIFAAAEMSGALVAGIEVFHQTRRGRRNAADWIQCGCNL